MKKASTVAVAAIALLFLIALAVPATAAEIKIISGPATAGVLAELGPQFERASGHKLTSKGGVTGVLKQLIESGEQFDLAIIPGSLMEDFAKQGKFAQDAMIPFVRVGQGMGIRKGAPKPDISSTDKFKDVLLKAKSITYPAEGETAGSLGRVFDRLGIAEQMKPKIMVRQTPALASQAVANGEIELYFALTTVVASGQGIELVGTLPSELQNSVVINMGVSASSKEPEGARALLKFLAADANVAAIKAKGLERVGK